MGYDETAWPIVDKHKKYVSIALTVILIVILD